MEIWFKVQSSIISHGNQQIHFSFSIRMKKILNWFVWVACIQNICTHRHAIDRRLRCMKFVIVFFVVVVVFIFIDTCKIINRHLNICRDVNAELTQNYHLLSTNHMHKTKRPINRHKTVWSKKKFKLFLQTTFCVCAKKTKKKNKIKHKHRE